MKQSRRDFLKKCGIGAASLTLAVALPVHSFLHNIEMAPAPTLTDYVLCDLHAHPGKYHPDPEILAMLRSPGMVGLGFKQTEPRILSYEEAMKRYANHPLFRGELTSGKLARFGQGYFARTQEIFAGRHHLLAVGWDGAYFANNQDPRPVIDEIHRHNGIAILNHPMVLSGGKLLGVPRYHIATETEQQMLLEVCGMVDAVEAYNAHAVNLVPGLAWLSEGNDLAEELADSCRKPATSSADAHWMPEQVKTCGIYVRQEIIEQEGMKGLVNAIKEGDFLKYGNTTQGPYISNESLLEGLVWEKF